MVTSLRRSERLRESIGPFLDFFTGTYAALTEDPETANFAVGNPHEIAMPASRALATAVVIICLAPAWVRRLLSATYMVWFGNWRGG